MPVTKPRRKVSKTGQRKTVSKENRSNTNVELGTQKEKKKNQYEIGNYCKFTGKQMKNWKPMNKQLKDYLYQLIDSGVNMVESKPQFCRDRDVQKVLSNLKLQLKAKLHTVKIPNKKYCEHSKLKAQVAELTSKAEDLARQEQQLDKARREEERVMESLEELKDLPADVELHTKVPENVLEIPDFPV